MMSSLHNMPLLARTRADIFPSGLRQQSCLKSALEHDAAASSASPADALADSPELMGAGDATAKGNQGSAARLPPQPVAQQLLWPAPLSVGQGQLGERASSSGSSPPRPWVDREKADREKALAFVIERLLEQVVPPEDSEAVAAGVLDALSAPGSGLPAGMLLSVVTQMAGRWEVGEDAGLLSLAKSVEQELRASAGKLLVRFKVRPPRGGPAFDCEGLEGMSLK
ncbi:unnamed protein product, partial [Polarella glacialis]